MAPPLPLSLKNSIKKGKIHPEVGDSHVALEEGVGGTNIPMLTRMKDRIKTVFQKTNNEESNSEKGHAGTSSKEEVSKPDSSNNEKSTESSLQSRFTKIDKTVSGHTSTIVHKEFASFGNDLLNFEKGGFLHEYYAEVGKREGGGKVNLPVPKVVHVNNEDCTIVQSFRYSSAAKIVFRVLQCFAKVRNSSKSIELVFWSVRRADVPDEAQTSETTEFFKLHGLTVLDDEYSEDGNMKLSSLSHQQTQFVYNIKIGFFSKSLSLVKVHKLLQSALDLATVANKKFDRSDEVDNAVQSHFINNVMPNVPLSKDEKKSIDYCIKSLKYGDDFQTWSRLPQNLNDTVQKFTIDNDGKLVIVKGITIVDERAEVIMSYLIHFTSNERNKIGLELNGDLERSMKNDDKSHTSRITSEVKSPPPITNRRFVGSHIWAKEWGGNVDTFVIASLPDKDDGTTAKGVVLATTTALFVIERLAERVSRITQLQKTDLKLPDGFIGDAINKYAAKYSLLVLDELYTKYERKQKEVDSDIRLEFIKKIASAPPISTEYTSLVETCKQLVTDFDTSVGMKETNLKKLSHYGEMSMKRKEKRGYCERSIGMGRCVEVIDAPPEVVTSWLYDFCSKDRQRIDREAGHIARLSFANDGRQQLIASVKRVQWPFSNREFVTILVWWKELAHITLLIFRSTILLIMALRLKVFGVLRPIWQNLSHMVRWEMKEG